MSLITAVYKFKNEVFVGIKEEKLNEIKEFSIEKSLDSKLLLNDRLYISLIEDKNEKKKMYVLEDIPLVDIEKSNVETETVGHDFLLELSNLLVKNFVKKTTYH